MSIYKKQVKKIEALRDAMFNLTDDELLAKTAEFKERIANGESTDALLPEAFAAVREATRRENGKEHYPVQLMGGVGLYHGDVVEMSTGEGKCVSILTPVPTPSGWISAGNIHVGDIVFDRQGKPTTITGVYPQGKRQIYEVVLKDGRKIECCEDHRWAVYTEESGKDWVVKTTKEMYETKATWHGYRYQLPVNQCVEYAERELPLDPYALGVFLGCSIKNEACAFTLSNIDEEIITGVASKIGAYQYQKKPDGAFGAFYDETGRVVNVNDVTFDEELIHLLLNTCVDERFIPEAYRLASEEQRLELLKGLFDAGGDICDAETVHKYEIQYLTTSSRLRDDIMETLYSLGISCSWQNCKKVGSETDKCDQYIIKLNLPNKEKYKLFRLSRKKKIAEEAKNFTHSQDYSRIAITDIIKTNRFEKQVCFTVDNEEHLFLVGNYVVTHNTQTCFPPAYLKSLTGEAVHVVTVNDYLAQRDAEEAQSVLKRLGVSVGCVLSEMQPEERKAEYACDITYITNSEAGFDYLRDNMVINENDRVQRGLNYAIIDEVDSILIDEARTPLIISGKGPVPSDMYKKCDILAKKMRKGEKLDKTRWEESAETGDFVVDEKEKTVVLTERGVKKVEKFFHIQNYSDAENMEIQHGMIMALRANHMMEKNKEYVVQDGKVNIVDEFTGRILDGRRYSDGLHQAIEAKEGVEIQSENMTIATITFQHYFNKYVEKAGMTGTAMTEKNEFKDIFGMHVVSIPTNKPVIRVDEEDRVYVTKKEKFHEVIEEILKAHEKGQPVLVGTTTVENSELLSLMLRKRGIPHQVLNAKYHAKEAEIVAHAGEHGAITIATNMAGRGTDIKPDSEAIKAGGLLVIGTERHEARRIDNQLRGRSGRQGDPGRSVFFLSLEDEVIKRYGNEKVLKAVRSLVTDENQLIQSKGLSKAIARAQKRIEGQHYNIRKNLLEYDEVNNEQRELVYAERNRILANDNIAAVIHRMAKQAADEISEIHAVDDDEFKLWCKTLYSEMPDQNADIEGIEKKKAVAYQLAEKNLEMVKSQFSEEEAFQLLVNNIFLRVLDNRWKQHIDDLAHLREGIVLKSYGQKDPRVEYKIAAYEMFQTMLKEVRNTVVSIVCSTRVQIRIVPRPAPVMERGVDENGQSTFRIGF